MPKQSLLLLCSEKAAYVYSFTHVMQVNSVSSCVRTMNSKDFLSDSIVLLFFLLSQGVKKVIHKKKFQASCCWASTFYTSSDVGLILLFTSGKVEIR